MKTAVSHLWLLLLYWGVSSVDLSVDLPSSSSVSVRLVAPDGPLLAVAGRHLVLPCSLSPRTDVQNMTVVWFRPGHDTQTHVHMYRGGADRSEDQSQSYRGRAAFFPDGISSGNVSLRLDDVKLSDAGVYQCTVDAGGGNYDNKEMEVQVRAVGTEPTIVTDRRRNQQLDLRCVSTGWSPEPVVDWLDSEGRNLPAEPTQMRLQSDGYRVERRLLVDSRRSGGGGYYCRVTQMGLVKMTRMNHTDEDEDVPEDSPYMDAILPVVAGLVVLCFGFARWRSHTHRNVPPSDTAVIYWAETSDPVGSSLTESYTHGNVPPPDAPVIYGAETSDPVGSSLTESYTHGNVPPPDAPVIYGAETSDPVGSSLTESYTHGDVPPPDAPVIYRAVSSDPVGSSLTESYTHGNMPPPYTPVIYGPRWYDWDENFLA
ncbi:butyrophilin subfamily 1 member A1-like isoform X2 [Clupea harengus]|uniref:Butyrophilin subfamily 1 member A1-like isoform X2 n=1 Tax=Clupea harengus TaxID=7950 RepID=A0A8M1KBI1_CLUHA|nr:butyrophilin subfamily 1 member A1-like isoform X2 [Clupea harengus]